MEINDSVIYRSRDLRPSRPSDFRFQLRRTGDGIVLTTPLYQSASLPRSFRRLSSLLRAYRSRGLGWPECSATGLVSSDALPRLRLRRPALVRCR